MSPHAVSNGTQPSKLREIPLSYDTNASDASAKELVFTLFPQWRDGEGEVEFTRFKDGITNTLMKAVKNRPGASEEELDKDAILLRAYGNGTEVLIDRERETTSHSVLAQHGLAPELLARFNNGLLYRFIPGSVCTPPDLTQERIWRGVARRIGEWHASLPILNDGKTAVVKDHVRVPLLESMVPSGNFAAVEKINALTQKPVPNIWSVMQKWILALSTDTKEERAMQATLQKELERSAVELSNTPGLGGNGLVFGHCDLLSANVIIPSNPASSAPTNGSANTNGHSTEDVASIDFIDYEYATPSPPAFDLANHFSEWGGFECDYPSLPTSFVRRSFIEEYIASYRKHDTFRALSQQAQHDTDLVERLCSEIDLFRGIPGLYWGIWALIQAKISQIDFDYKSYAQVRLAEYWGWRDESSGKREKEGKEMTVREKRWAQK